MEVVDWWSVVRSSPEIGFMWLPSVGPQMVGDLYLKKFFLKIFYLLERECT